MRQGFFGGTFDPIHEGHLDVARAARRAMALDTVTFVPAAIPPHRAVPRASAAHRFAMVALAIQGEAGFRLSDIEVGSPSPSYTATTLDRLAAQGIDTPRAFLTLGADAFRDIPTWKTYPAILDRCSFVVVSRPTCAATEMRRALPGLADRMADVNPAGPAHDLPAPKIFLVDAVTAPVSSTDIRRRMAEGASIDGLVPAAVAEYISTHGLYLEKAPTPAR